MNLKLSLIGTAAYTLVTFPLAILWHVVCFKDIYTNLGYFEGEPNFLLGLLTIMIQGAVLSGLYPYLNFAGNSIFCGLKYSLVMGGFFWTSHVLAFVAKQTVNNAMLFITMETFYLFLQFGIFGVLIGLIYSKQDKT